VHWDGKHTAVTYSAESWTLTTEIEQKMDACENRWLHRLLRINYKDRIHLPTEKLERKKMIQLSNMIRRMLMKRTGYILRMSDNKTVKVVFRWEPSSRRWRGRPKKRWMDCVEDLHRAGISRYGITTGRQRVSLREIAGDTSQWRELVAASTAGASFVMTTDFPWPN